jgi:hypothetical protein
MAELVDAYVSGAYARKGVGVRLPLPAQKKGNQRWLPFLLVRQHLFHWKNNKRFLLLSFSASPFFSGRLVLLFPFSYQGIKFGRLFRSEG